LITSFFDRLTLWQTATLIGNRASVCAAGTSITRLTKIDDLIATLTQTATPNTHVPFGTNNSLFTALFAIINRPVSTRITHPTIRWTGTTIFPKGSFANIIAAFTTKGSVTMIRMTRLQSRI
jgi:hypothetical protein